MQPVLAAVATSIAGLLGLTPLAAHHSTAEFDSDKVIKIEGTVKDFRWINPHASLKMEGVAEGDAPDGLWTVEMTAANILISQGWTRNAVKAGDRVVMFVNPLKNPITLQDGSQGGLYVGVILADGKPLGYVDGKPSTARD
jgi:hypothetical protein